MSQKEGCEVEIDGEDAMNVEVYKQGSESIVWGLEKGRREKRSKRKDTRKKKVNRTNLIQSSLLRSTRREPCIYLFLNKKTRFLLVHALGQSPLLLLFFLTSYKFY